MSELINNRQEQLKAIIKKIHNGLPLDEAKVIFKEQFGTITTEEITSMEHKLIEEGMPVSEVQKLCDVHAALFNGSISDIHKSKDISEIPGHPAYVLKKENERIQEVVNDEIKTHLGKGDKTSNLLLTVGFERLSEISKHYSRKEYLLFPILEKKGITSIPKVMWGVDNEIKASIKDILSKLKSIEKDDEQLFNEINQTISRVEDMIIKENNILLPLLSDNLDLKDWFAVDKGSSEIGYFLEAPTQSWKNESLIKQDKTAEIKKNTDSVSFDAGELTPVELNSILNTIPFDMTFIDKNGLVKYFTQGSERIFDRPKTIIGRHVNNCHPPQSVHIVEEIVKSFKDGTKDHEDFWINMQKAFVHIRYYAIRDKEGEYIGTLEVTQDIKPLRDLQGEKRLKD
jgi:DUF438 domain-containing protein